jgi:hypothetical protein
MVPAVRFQRDDQFERGAADWGIDEHGMPYLDQYFFNDSGGALTLNDWVAIDVTKTVADAPAGMQSPPILGEFIIQSPAGADDARIIGVLVEACADQTWGRVRRLGRVVNANVADAVTAGQLLQNSGTAGRAEAAGAVTQRVIGFAYTDGDGSNDATVEVRCLS